MHGTKSEQSGQLILHPRAWGLWYRVLVERWFEHMLELAIISLLQADGPLVIKRTPKRDEWTPNGPVSRAPLTFDDLPNEIVAKIARRLPGATEAAVFSCLR